MREPLLHNTLEILHNPFRLFALQVGAEFLVRPLAARNETKQASPNECRRRPAALLDAPEGVRLALASFPQVPDGGGQIRSLVEGGKNCIQHAGLDLFEQTFHSDCFTLILSPFD